LAEAGDIMIAHPWLAHGIGKNFSPHTRLAMYVRITNKKFKH